MPVALVQTGQNVPTTDGAVCTAWIGGELEGTQVPRGAGVLDEHLAFVMDREGETRMVGVFSADEATFAKYEGVDPTTRELIEDAMLDAAELSLERDGNTMAAMALVHHREDSLDITVYVAGFKREGEFPTEHDVDEVFASELPRLVAEYERAEEARAAEEARVAVEAPAPAVEAPAVKAPQRAAPPERLHPAQDQRRRYVAYLGADHAEALHEAAAERTAEHAGLSDQALAERRDKLGDIAWEDFDRAGARMHRTLQTRLAGAIEQGNTRWEATERKALAELTDAGRVPDYDRFVGARRDALVEWLAADNQVREQAERAVEPPGRARDEPGIGVG
jgi:hypothetical protein